jgi:hypothetical protein
MQSSIRAPDLAPSPLAEGIKDMRGVIARVKFHSVWECENPIRFQTIVTTIFLD